MDIRSIRAQQGHQDTKLGKLIRELCNEIEKRDKKIAKYQFILTQVVQLQKRETRKIRVRRAA